MLEKLAREQPRVLACMHGSAWRGDGAWIVAGAGEELGREGVGGCGGWSAASNPYRSSLAGPLLRRYTAGIWWVTSSRSQIHYEAGLSRYAPAMSDKPTKTRRIPGATPQLDFF